MPRSQSHPLVPWLTFAVVALIAYGSLYPFNFKPDAIPGGLREAFDLLSWARAGRSDRVSNVLLYLPLGFCLCLWLEARVTNWVAVLLALAIGAGLSLSIEIAQVFVSPRVPSLWDLTFNATGSLLGALAGAGWRGMSGLMQLPSAARTDGLALATLCFWAAWRLAPYLPAVDLARFKAALLPLAHPSLRVGEAARWLVCWLVVAQAILGLSGRRTGLEMLLAMIAFVLVGRLLIVDQPFLASELAALLVLMPVLVVLNRLLPLPRRQLLLAGLILAYTLETLRPLEFSADIGIFDLWPFLGWMEAGMPIDAPELFRKFFYYAAALWLLRESRLPLPLAGGLLTVFLLAIELIHLWQPAHQASITDPALAAGLTWLLAAAADARHPGRR